jgi:hypothetical protein
MRLPRMTTRRWMIAVAAIGLMIGGGVWLEQRRDYLLSLARSHQKEVASSTARAEALKSRFRSASGMSNGEIMHLHGDYDLMIDRADHHASLARNYEQAAHYPWLFVEPDPPEQ